jgi:type IV secretory pathway TrbD component
MLTIAGGILMAYLIYKVVGWIVCGLIIWFCS